MRINTNAAKGIRNATTLLTRIKALIPSMTSSDEENEWGKLILNRM